MSHFRVNHLPRQTEIPVKKTINGQFDGPGIPHRDLDRAGKLEIELLPVAQELLTGHPVTIPVVDPTFFP